MKEPGCSQSMLYQEVSHANLTALVGNVWRLMMSAIFGVSFSESFAKLTQSGSWEKMYRGCSQVKMEGFSDEFLGTWPKWGVMSGGIPSSTSTVSTTGRCGIFPSPRKHESSMY